MRAGPAHALGCLTAMANASTVPPLQPTVSRGAPAGIEQAPSDMDRRRPIHHHHFVSPMLFFDRHADWTYPPGALEVTVRIDPATR
jgi:hypothetical protein